MSLVESKAADINICHLSNSNLNQTLITGIMSHPEQLIIRCQQNDPLAQEQLFRLYAPKLYAICLKYSRNSEEAEDSLHDSFLLIFNKIQQYAFKGSFEGWLKRLTLSTVLQKYRRPGIFEVLTHEIADDTNPIQIDEEDYSLEYLLALVQELPDRYRLTFSLYVLDGFSHKEISKLLNISEGTSKSNLARAKIALRNRIERDGSQQNSQIL